MTLYVAGLDLGQAADFTALAIIEARPTTHQVEVDVLDRRYGVGLPEQRRIEGPPVSLYLGWLERYELGTRYPAIVTHVNERTRALPGPCLLAIDHTGVGRAVVDLFHESGAEYVAITITGGDQVNGEGRLWRVPKRDLVHGLLVALQEGRFTYAAQLPLVQTFVTELTSFQLKIHAATGHDTYEAWREGAHDDIVLAVALAVWLAEQEIAMRAQQALQALDFEAFDPLASGSISPV